MVHVNLVQSVQCITPRFKVGHGGTHSAALNVCSTLLLGRRQDRVRGPAWWGTRGLELHFSRVKLADGFESKLERDFKVYGTYTAVYAVHPFATCNLPLSNDLRPEPRYPFPPENVARRGATCGRQKQQINLLLYQSLLTRRTSCSTTSA